MQLALWRNDMSTFTDVIKDVLPFIGTALGGPLGGAAATFLGSKLGLPNATVATITDALQGMGPEKLAELKTADQEFQLKMAALGYDSTEKLEELNTRNLEAVNKTMQSESASEHWPTYTWRPFIGFMFGFYIASLWLLPTFGKTPVTLSSDIVFAIGGILGVASYFRGKAQADPDNTKVSTKG